MRISTSYQYSAYQLDIQNTTQKFFEAQQQVSTGKRINRISDDPTGMAKSLNMRTLMATYDGYSANLQTAKGILGTTDNNLSSMNDIANSAYQAALSGANSTMDQNARNALVDQISQLQSRLVTLANSRGPGGEYLFAGQKNDQPPYSVGPTGITYAGDNRSVVIPTDANSTMTVSTPGEPMISNLYNQLETLKNDLTGGNVGALSGIDVTNFQNAQKQITAERGTIGAKMQTVQTLATQFAQRKDDLTGNISDIEDVDPAAAILHYQQAQNAYQAALTVAGHGFKMSLMDFITT